MPSMAQSAVLPTVRAAELIEILTSAIPKRWPVLVAGDPGIGKTAIIKAVCKALGYKLIISHPATNDPTDYKGMPPIAGGQFLPIGEAAEALAATEPTVWFFDDLAQGDESVQKAAMHVFHGGHVGGRILPDCVSIVAATNERGKTGVRGLLEPVKSRFATIIKLLPDLDHWIDWACGAGIEPMVIAFLKRYADNFHVYEPSNDLTNGPCARTWEHASDWEQLGLSDASNRAVLEGAVGAVYAGNYRQFKLAHRSLVDVKDILANPRTAALPKSPGEMYAVAVTLARVANRKTFPAVATYCERIFDAKHGEVATLTIRTAVKLNPEVTLTDAYIRMQGGKYAEILAGAN